MANYNYVIPFYYNPILLDLELKAAAIYKDSYDKMEELYVELKDKSNQFKYLSETLPADSNARRVYENYANDLNVLADSFLLNGLTQGSRRTLAELRGRYSGEIGRIVKANTMLELQQLLRLQMALKDPSYRYATDNLNIDDFMDGKTPNLYGVSINNLYARGVNAGKAASSRLISTSYGNMTLGGYFYDIVQKMGYPNAAEFRKDMDSIPELKAAWEGIKKETGMDLLAGINKEQAEQGILNGIIDGMIYQDKHDFLRNVGVFTPQEKLQALMQGYKQQADGSWKFDAEEYAQSHPQKETMERLKYSYDENGNITGLSSGYAKALELEQLIKAQYKQNELGDSQNVTKLDKPKRVEFKSSWGKDDPREDDFDVSKKMAPKTLSTTEEHIGNKIDSMQELPESILQAVRKEIPGSEYLSDELLLLLYSIYYRPYESGIFNDTEPAFDIFPNKKGDVKINTKQKNTESNNSTNSPTNVGL